MQQPAYPAGAPPPFRTPGLPPQPAMNMPPAPPTMTMPQGPSSKPMYQASNGMPQGPPSMPQGLARMPQAPSTLQSHSGMPPRASSMPQGPPGMPQGSNGLPSGPQGPPGMFQGPAGISQGPPSMPRSSAGMTQHPMGMSQGPPQMSQGPPQMSQGPPQMSQGPPQMSQGPPQMSQGPPQMSQGPPPMSHGAPPMSHGAPPLSQAPPPMSHGAPPMSHGAPPMSHGAPPVSQPSAPTTPGLSQLQQQMSNVSLGNSQNANVNSSNGAPAPTMTNGISSHPAPPMSSMPGPPMSGAPIPPMSRGPMPPMSGAPMPPMSGAPMPPMSAAPMPPMSGAPMPSRPGMPPLPGQGMAGRGGMPGQQNMQAMAGYNQPSTGPPTQGYPSQGPPSQGGFAPGGMANRYPGSQQQQQQQPLQQQPQLHGQQPQQPQQYGGAQQQGGRRLNPDDMPSPLQVIEEDKRNRTGEFNTGPRGAVPPMVTTKFVVRDGGNASPRFIRSTMYSIPTTPDMIKQTSVPFGLVISPLAEMKPGEGPLYPGTTLANGPVRCNRCKAYMSPFMQFMDGGRRFQCLLCHQTNDTPAEYYCNMDSQGARADKYQRPELCLGTFEYIATPEYCRDKVLPKEPAFIFVMEMSQLMIQRGVISLLCQNMSQLLQHLPKDSLGGQTEPNSKVKVGFITYDSNVHFYKLDGKSPEMCVVCDKSEMFVPVPEGVLCDINDAAQNISKLMDNIPQIFQGAKENSGVLASAIQAGMSALKASGRTGKLFVFHSSLPQTEGPAKLKPREDRKLLGTEKEKSILGPQTNFYNNLGQELVLCGCGVDLFVFNDSYVDLSTIGQVSRITGGQVLKYSLFQRDHDGPRLLHDLQRNLSKEVVFDVVMRVRTSTGVRPVEFYGHFFMANTQDIEFGSMDASKAVAVEVKHDDKLAQEDGVYVQAALLYTSVGGQRRLRVINLAFNTCNQMADLYKNCDLDTLMNFFGKMAMFKFMDSTAKQFKEQLVSRTANILACYRKNCATPSAAGQLILPELLKLLPLYVNCLSRCEALSGGQDISCDDRALHIYHLSTCTVEASTVYYYPRLIPLMETQHDGIPTPVRTSYEKLRPDSAFLLENGMIMFLWVGSSTPSHWMNDVFNVNAPHQLDPTLSELPVNDNPTSVRVRAILDEVRAESSCHSRLFVVPQQGKHEVVLRSYLVEDKGVYGSPSYVDFLCHIHKEIRTLMQ